MKILYNQKSSVFFSIILGSFALIPLLLSFIEKMGRVPYFGLNFGILSGISCALILRILSKTYPKIAAYPPLVIATLMVFKPKIAPVMHSYGKLEAFSYTSETHLYFVLPGIAVIIISFLFLLMYKDE